MIKLMFGATIAAFLFGLATACTPTTYDNVVGSDTDYNRSDSGDDDDDNDNNDNNDNNDDNDNDSDTGDTDSDSGSDSESDSESDNDTDDNTGKDTDCPQGSAYPCSCDSGQGELCNDGSSCIAPREDAIGVCTWECSGDTDPVCDAGDWGIPGYGGVCGTLTSDGKDYCGVICKDETQTADCPPDLTCTDITGGGICTGS